MSQPIEQHTVSYLDQSSCGSAPPPSCGIYVDGNRTQDQYSLRPGASASGTRVAGTASYSYDPRDRLVQNDDGHGDVTKYGLDGNGNIQTQTQNGSTTSYTYQGNQLQQLMVGGVPKKKYWYDDLGRQQCVTDATGSQSDCNPSENTSAKTDLLQDYRYDYLDRLLTYRAFSSGSRTDEADYTYDALSRVVQELEQHPSFNGDTHSSQFSYLGPSGLETEEQQSSKSSGNTLAVKDFTYDAYAHRLDMVNTLYNSGQPGAPTTYTYGYDVHGSVSQLVDPSGNTTASYGYQPYGQPDSQLSQGDSDQTSPLNPFRFEAKRQDSGSGTVDMGFRRFGPDISRFITPDFFYGALANLSLSTDPLTQNRYVLAGGNPVSLVEWDGHFGFGDIISWAGEHKADIAGFAAGAVVGTACEAAFGVETAGLASFGCAAAAGAVANVVTHALTTKDQSVQGYVEAGAEGAVEGAVGFGVGKYVLRPILKAGASRLVSRGIDDALDDGSAAATDGTSPGGGASAADTPAPAIPAGKTVATAAGERTLSGWGAAPPGYVRATPEQVLQLQDEIGFPIRPAGAYDQGVPGRYFASHAERQQAVLYPGAPIEVSSEMCTDCIGFFTRLAEATNVTQIVSDPAATRIFTGSGGTFVE